MKNENIPLRLEKLKRKARKLVHAIEHAVFAGPEGFNEAFAEMEECQKENPYYHMVEGDSMRVLVRAGQPPYLVPEGQFWYAVLSSPMDKKTYLALLELCKP